MSARTVFTCPSSRGDLIGAALADHPEARVSVRGDRVSLTYGRGRRVRPGRVSGRVPGRVPARVAVVVLVVTLGLVSAAEAAAWVSTRPGPWLACQTYEVPGALVEDCSATWLPWRDGEVRR